MLLIPAGSFTIGDALDGEADAIPKNGGAKGSGRAGKACFGPKRPKRKGLTIPGVGIVFLQT
jgi:hypothetical protein